MNCSDGSTRVTADRGPRGPRFFAARRLLTWLILGLSSSGVVAHDFFLWPDVHHAAVGQALDVRFSVGHGGDYEGWAHGKTKVLSFTDHGPQAIVDALDGVAVSAARVSLVSQGTHVLSLISGQSTSVLPAEKFNAYLLEEGLTAIVAHRQRYGMINEPGIENYSRRAKALIQVGSEATDNVTRPLGLLLELVPLSNPYALGDDEPLTLQVLFRGEPLAGASVAFESLTVAQAGEQTTLTDKEGQVSFTFPKVGQWKVNVVWGMSADTAAQAPYETLFSSLTFGYGVAASPD